jgi:3-polyprenyl-4-hydroxybenzoate decarboxylase
MTPEQLMIVYPNLDFLMAETILNCHDNGTLAACIDAPSIETEAMILTPITIQTPDGP